MSQFRPMLAGKCPEDLGQLQFPLFASAKLDGWRCLIKDGVAFTRRLKPIRNKFVQSILGNQQFNGLDGEVIVGPPNAPNAMQATTSGLSSIEGEPDFTYHVFDEWDRGQDSFENSASYLISRDFPAFIKVLPQQLITNVSDLEQFETDCLSQSYEGVITRTLNSQYKFGRSTTKQQWLLKLKRFETDEAIIVGTEELMHNANEATTDALGLTERSSHQENKIGMGKLGALVCRQLTGYFLDVVDHPNGKEELIRPHGSLGNTGPTFNVGSGFTEFDRQTLWATRDSLIGKTITFKHFAQTGVIEKPRNPVFVSFRDASDI